jgi:Ni2+-binding GTPase involved in maturation of urease and hydrogenase
VPVGGFLGAGKTTLIHAAAGILKTRDLRCAAILNDQGSDLVDTAHTQRQAIATDEVTGGCFCCRFSELLSAADRLRELEPDIIFIEPVGSCTDLATTVVRPLQRNFLDNYRVAPLTVLVDPDQARKVSAGLADAAITYLFEHQLAEADLVVLNKCDLLSTPPVLSGISVRHLSAVTGTGVAAWLDEVLSGEIAAGAKNLAIDYKEYAAAEAALAWLNWSATVESRPAISAAQLVGPFVDELQAALTGAGATIAHVKVLAQTPGSYLKVALTSNDDEPIVQGDLAASPSSSQSLRVNVRALLGDTELERIFRRTLQHLSAVWSTEHFQCFSPAAPVKP